MEKVSKNADLKKNHTAASPAKIIRRSRRPAKVSYLGGVRQ